MDDFIITLWLRALRPDLIIDISCKRPVQTVIFMYDIMVMHLKHPLDQSYKLQNGPYISLYVPLDCGRLL